MSLPDRPVILVLYLGLGACATERTAAPEPFVVVASVKQLMQAITVPTSDAVWAAATDPPQEDAGWERIEVSAAALAESGNLLLMGERAVDRGNWVVQTRSMIDAALLAAEAARARDVERLLDAGDLIYDSCTSCHLEYLATR